MHIIDIPKRYVDNCISRRGKKYIFDKIDPKKTGLLVIDMQNCFIVPGLSIVEVPGVEKIAPNINALANSMRTVGGKVLWTEHVYTPGWSSWYDHFTDKESRQSIVKDTAKGSYAREIWKGMDKRSEDLLITKTRSSALTPGSSNLGEVLENLEIDTLIITGTLTNVCCESTARDAMLLNYKTIFVGDATGTRSDEEHNATLINMMQFFADLRMTKDTIDLIENSS